MLATPGTVLCRALGSSCTSAQRIQQNTGAQLLVKIL